VEGAQRHLPSIVMPGANLDVAFIARQVTYTIGNDNAFRQAGPIMVRYSEGRLYTQAALAI
jgi:hypothetical protein